jgi:hypothetical protein
MHRSLRHRISTNLFLMLDRVGVHVLPKHFYTPIADYSWLRSHRDAWEPPWDMAGVRWDLDQQLDWLRSVTGTYLNEVAGLDAYNTLLDYGLGYGPIESQVLHCFVRKYAPRRIIEVGSGVSTACMVEAVRRNRAEGRNDTAILCVEPYPRARLMAIPTVTHVRSHVQTVDRSVFDGLAAGDLLFIDSSHAVKTGSDVAVLFLQIIPKLQPGVYVHIHDVNLPYLYVRETLTTVFGWQETALLAALLCGNRHLRVMCALSALHYDRQPQLRDLLPDYQPQTRESGLAASDEDPDLHFPSSIFLQTS